MNSSSEGIRRRRLRVASQALAGLVLAIGCLVLIGWALNIHPLKSPIPNMVSMKANAAIGFILVGLGLLLPSIGRSPSWNRAAQLFASITFLIGLVTIVEYILGINLFIDQLFFRDTDVVGTSVPGRMGPNTAIGFLLMGLALLLLLLPLQHGPSAAQLLAAITGLIALAAILGYAFGAEDLYGFGRYTQMALHTA
ncbi:MAG TPA: hypothetical protein VHS06_02075, partial [Chloroflexota bacterium]|nr:hypothetical protein [Chloroflexota bacterium]